LITIRDVEKRVARDNVVFELGLFIGRLGQEQSFIIKPRGEELHLPTDIMGLTPLDFPIDRDDKNLQAALGPACHSIRCILKDSFDNHQSEDDSDATSDEEKATESDSVVILTSWLKQNIGSIVHVVLFYRKLDNDLKLYPDTSKTHIKQIAEKMNLIVEEESEHTIMFKRGPMRVITRDSGRRFGEW
jgi:CAP12/Pycsar effector protein, TIR domain